eukprot:7315093-Pyramimonas_sp.AAC.1
MPCSAGEHVDTASPRPVPGLFSPTILLRGGPPHFLDSASSSPWCRRHSPGFVICSSCRFRWNFRQNSHYWTCGAQASQPVAAQWSLDGPWSWRGIAEGQPQGQGGGAVEWEPQG